MNDASEAQSATGERSVLVTQPLNRVLREAALVVLLAVAGFMLLALVTYDPEDPGWSYKAATPGVANQGGIFGAYFADLTLYLFGYLAYLLPVLVVALGVRIYRWQRAAEPVRWGLLTMRFAGFLVAVVAGDVLAYYHFEPVAGTVPMASGGAVGTAAGSALRDGFGFDGATLLALAFFLAGVTVFSGVSWIQLMDAVGRWVLRLGTWCRRMVGSLGRMGAERRKSRAAESVSMPVSEPVISTEPPEPPRIEPPETAPAAPKPSPKRSKAKRAAKRETSAPAAGEGSMPPVTLLDDPPQHERGYSQQDLDAMSELVETKLGDFGVSVEVAAVHPGPVVTRFELQPAPGVKVSKITNLSKDLARALSVTSVRVVEVIPGKSVVGLEIPNKQRESIALSEIVRSDQYQQSKSALSLAIGKDIGGQPVVVDLGKMPHLLVAGTTGSGKSVGVNGMILSLLYKNTPEEVRTIMIDPKMLELSVYENIPHLLAPVVTDMNDAANALRWCVAEMERRYKLMASLGVRNIDGLNRRIREAREAGEPLHDPLWRPSDADAIDPEASGAPELETMPYVVVVVDEFADMMMMVGKKVEELIARLAQKARAAGIHLILATQRPSVDVITGLIKANIPTRMAFQVSSKVDSRTILDQMGAESLLGHGDMLYAGPSSRGIPERVHGAFVSDAEVHRVVEHLQSMGGPDYARDILQEAPQDAPNVPGMSADSGGEDADPLYDQAVQVVTETQKASISGVQRRLKIGYNRAARLVEEMEAAGVVGPLESNGSRQILASAPPPTD
jgi:S-DNA-T family DNA segregation ATPase FtsK/SpoIIIE